MKKTRRTLLAALTLAAVASGGCATNEPGCAEPQSKHLETAIAEAQAVLAAGCAAHFDRFYDRLLVTAEGDPKPENKRLFSDFLVWSGELGLLSTRQAQDYYNRYFNLKFMSMRSDYNNCSHTCPNKQRMLLDMERELSDKERGLLKISSDSNGYYRADRLYQEVELVLEATCAACAAGR